jgi:hypothetical protein
MRPAEFRSERVREAYSHSKMERSLDGPCRLAAWGVGPLPQRQPLHRAQPVCGRRCWAIGVLHISHASVGVTLCTSPKTRTHTTQRPDAAPSRGERLHDSLFFVNGFSCVCAANGIWRSCSRQNYDAAMLLHAHFWPQCYPPVVHSGQRFSTDLPSRKHPPSSADSVCSTPTKKAR